MLTVVEILGLILTYVGANWDAALPCLCRGPKRISVMKMPTARRTCKKGETAACSRALTPGVNFTFVVLAHLLRIQDLNLLILEYTVWKLLPTP